MAQIILVHYLKTYIPQYMRNNNKNYKEKYLESLYCKEQQLFTHACNNTISQRIIQLSNEEGKLLSMLLLLNKSKYVLEIGTLTGYSSFWIASSIPHHGKVITIEKNKHYCNIARSNLAKTPFIDKIQIINSNAINYLSYLTLDYKFDAVFIDAKKEEYPSYLKLVYPLIKIGGLIIADNTFLFGSIYKNYKHQYKKQWQAMRVFNQIISDQKKYISSILTTQEGLSISIKI